MPTDDAAESTTERAADDAASEGWGRWRDALAAAGRWAVDVFRGHARSMHLDNREE